MHEGRFPGLGLYGGKFRKFFHSVFFVFILLMAVIIDYTQKALALTKAGRSPALTNGV